MAALPAAGRLLRRWGPVFVAAVAGTLAFSVIRDRAGRWEPGGRAVLRFQVEPRELHERAAVGEEIDAWRGVVVRANGKPYNRSHGRHFAPDGFYYGRMWQCVEFVKRFYYDHFGHVPPDGMGHAKEFFDPAVPHGAVNPRRGLVQFVNGGGERPRLDDLMVWTQGTYGHVAIVSKVGVDTVEVVQQNVIEGTRSALGLSGPGTGWWVGGGGGNAPAGWLRMPGPDSALPPQQGEEHGGDDKAGRGE